MQTTMRCLLGLLILAMLGCSAAADEDWQSSWLWVTSPKANEDLSGEREVRIAWDTNLGPEAKYAVVYSTDGERFDRAIALGLTQRECVWSPDDGSGLVGWIKVKAFSAAGLLIAEDTVPVTFVPPDAVVVSKADQKVFVFADGKLQNAFVCSTALPKYDLRPGRYKVYFRSRNHHSREYDVAMPYALFFHRGYALHATRVIHRLGRPASHGCIRLHPRDARTLYKSVPVGTPVIVLPRSQSCADLEKLLARREAKLDRTLIAAQR